MESPIVRFGMIFFAIICIAASPVAMVSAKRKRDVGRASLEWPKTRGTILSSAIGNTYNGGKVSYKPKVVYAYDVGEVEYRSQRISMFDVGYGLRMDAEEVCERYVAGSGCEVFYDPSDPAKALLEPGFDMSDTILVFAVGPIMLIVGIGLVWAVAKVKKADP